VTRSKIKGVLADGRCMRELLWWLVLLVGCVTLERSWGFIKGETAWKRRKRGGGDGDGGLRWWQVESFCRGEGKERGGDDGSRVGVRARGGKELDCA